VVVPIVAAVIGVVVVIGIAHVASARERRAEVDQAGLV
jgi:hypothetical protein